MNSCQGSSQAKCTGPESPSTLPETHRASKVGRVAGPVSWAPQQSHGGVLQSPSDPRSVQSWPAPWTGSFSMYWRKGRLGSEGMVSSQLTSLTSKQRRKEKMAALG